MRNLPPQLDANTDGLDALTLTIHRPSNGREAFLDDAVIVVICVTPVVLGGLVWMAHAAACPLAFVYLAGLSLMYRLLQWWSASARPHVVRFEAHRFCIDDRSWSYGELTQVDFDDRPDDPLLTILQLHLHGGGTVRLPLLRRSFESKVGITHKQRAWLQRELQARVDTAGAPDQVPAALGALTER